MIRSRLTFLPVACAALLLGAPTQAQSLEDTFREGVQLLDQGKDEEALAKFRKVLAMDPGHEAAYELWQSTSHDVWMRLLVHEGQIELVAQELLDLARMGRQERMDDPDAVRALLGDLTSDDFTARHLAVSKLASEYGEYAVPVLIHSLSDRNNEDRRVSVMQALTQMGSDVVPPLIASLEAEDAFLRRNVALTLGYLGDRRAAGTLSRLADSDPDASVRESAGSALGRLGVTADGLSLLLAEADGYYSQADNVLRPHEYSDVVWGWEGKNLVSTPIPRFLYNFELAKQRYYDALQLAPSSTESLAGIARCTLTQRERIDEWDALGQDTGDWGERIANDELAVRIAGTQALDLALRWSLDHGDQIAASGLCQALGVTAYRPPANLRRAVQGTTSGAVRGEAALALGAIAFRSNGPLDPEAVAALTEAASREVVQIAAVIDADDTRRERVARELESRGMLVNRWTTGGRGLAMLRSIPGVDVLLVADELPDLTTTAVIRELKADPRTASAPILLLTDDEDSASDAFGDITEGAVTRESDLAGVMEAAMSSGLNRDREQAGRLASSAARALARLASTGHADVSSASTALGGLLGRNDAVAIPAMDALAYIGTDAQTSGLVAVIADAGRSDEVRLAAAGALSGIFGRTARTGDATFATLRGLVASSEEPFEVRAATAIALGRLDLPQAARAELMSALRKPSAAN